MSKIFLVAIFLTVSASNLLIGQDAAKQIAEAETKTVISKKPAFNPADFAKRLIEGPLEHGIAKGSSIARQPELLKLEALEILGRPEQVEKPGLTNADVSKFRIEAPLKRHVTPVALTNFKDDEKPADDSKAVAKSDNPAVKPGKVKWHKDFEPACIASEVSDKPVLHFQLLGQLDQRFT